jgi:hypothetical protein
LEEILPWAECLVLGTNIAEADEVFSRATRDQTIVDLAGVGDPRMTSAAYHTLGGRSWKVVADHEEKPDQSESVPADDNAACPAASLS